MDVYRKPATAQWYYGSAQKVDSQEISKAAWSEQRQITFDATKEKSGDRHTAMRVVLSESDVEHLYAGLIQGRKNEIRELTKQNDGLRKELKAASRAIKTHLDELDQAWQSAEYGSEMEARFRKLRDDFVEALGKVNEHWRWTW